VAEARLDYQFDVIPEGKAHGNGINYGTTKLYSALLTFYSLQVSAVFA
jgi:hypothetical protein